MPRRKKADMTYTQQVTATNDDFRKTALKAALEAEAAAGKPYRDDGTFRKDTYKQALKEAKDARKA